MLSFLFIKNQQCTSMRNTRTPSPYENSMQTNNQQNSHTSPYQQSDAENEEVEVFI